MIIPAVGSEVKSLLQSRAVRLCSIVLASVLYLILYWHPLLISGLIPFNADTLRLYYPSWVIGQKLLEQGRYFLWDPYRNMGQPFLAMPQNQAFYLLHPLVSFLNYLHYQQLALIFHLVLSATFAYLLAEKIFGGKTAVSLLLMLGWTVNGLLLFRITFHADFASACWLPAILYFLVCRRPLLLGVAMALLWLGGMPTFFAISFLIAAIFSWGDRPQGIALLKGTLWALGFISIQLLPFVQMALQSDLRTNIAGPFAFTSFLDPMEAVKNLIAPSFWSPGFRASWIHLSCFYLGPVFLLLALMGIWRGSQRERAIACAAILGFIMSWGPHNGFYEKLPLILIFRSPTNWLLMFVYCFSFVSAYGLSTVRHRDIRTVCVILAAADLLFFAQRMHPPYTSLSFFTDPPASFAEVASAIPQKERIFHAADIENNDSHWNWQYDDPFGFMKGLLTPSYASSLGLREVVSQTSLLNRRTAAYRQKINAAKTLSPLLDDAGVRYIIARVGPFEPGGYLSARNCRLIVNPHPKPRSFMETGAQPVTVLRDHPGDFLLEAEGPGRVIVSESFYPGWHAFIDGQESRVDIYRDNFLAVVIPPGKHQLYFHYWPMPFLAGVCISLGTIFLALFWTTFRSSYFARFL